MSISDTLSELKKEPIWNWYSCVFDLKKTLKNKEVFCNLAPSIVLNNPNSTEEKPSELNVICTVTLEKPFIYTEDMGWNWHKSWNIPNIQAKIEIIDPITNEKFLAPQKFFVEVIVAKAEFNEIQTFHLNDVGVKGNNKYQLQSNECLFSGLKFIPTSYNHEGSKFHLVVIFFLVKNNDDVHHILEAKISPPVFVDSRKTARENHKNLKFKEIYSFIEPFNPEKLKKIFIKRENKKNFGFEEEIENSLNGLIHYFSAPNIRNKVKHPLFLAIKFSNIVNLYYNSKIVGGEKDEAIIIEDLQKHLVEIYLSNSRKNYLKDKLLLLYVEDIYKANYADNKKTMDFFDLIETDCLQVISDQKSIPSHFVKIPITNSLITTYEKIYPKLILDKELKGAFELLKFKQSFKEDDEDNEEEEKKDSIDSEPDNTLIKMEEEAGHYTLSKKNKKKLKVVKNPQDQPNIAGPIKVEIDLTAEMAKQLSNKSLTDKVKLENNDETLPRNNLTPNARVKIENDTIYRDFALTKTKTEEPNQFHPNIIITSSNRNPQIIQMNTENILNLRTAVPSQILVTENHLGNYQFHHPNIHPTFSNNNVGMYQVMQDRYIKSLQNFMPSPNPMNYFGMLESSFANPFIYQEYMKLYMENMKKMYDLKK